MTATIPWLAVCMIEPMQKITPATISAGFLPYLSPSGATASEPKKQPACNNETTLAENAFVLASLAPASPKSFTNGSRVMVVPMNAKSYPKMNAPMEATRAMRYTRMLNTSAGGGELMKKVGACLVGIVDG